MSVEIVGCTFHGRNPDGSGPVQFESGDHRIKRDPSIKMVGWVCYSAEEHAKLMAMLALNGS